MESTANCDVIEELLQSTGLSCDELLVKLQQYKAIQESKSKKEESSSFLSSFSKEENVNNEKQITRPSDEESVIVETKSSSENCNDSTTDKCETESANKQDDTTTEECSKENVPQDSENLLSQNTDDTSAHSLANEDDSVTNNSPDLENESEITENNSESNENTIVNDEEPIKVTQNCTSIDEHNYSNVKTELDAEFDVSTSSADDLCKTEDDIRNIIRMQLSSLRNMKKSNPYLPDLQKKKTVFFHSLKKKRKSCDVNSLTTASLDEVMNDETKETEENKNTGDNKEVGGNDNSLISLSDEVNFIISEVTGGVDRLPPNNDETSKPAENEERRFAVITESNRKTETDSKNKGSHRFGDTSKVNKSPRREIKNILTNYRRKMSLNYFDENRYNLTTSKTNEKPKGLTIKKNFAESFSEDPGINKSVKNNEKSPFVSDSLDDFLSESAQLKISYSIPKLRAEEGIKEGAKESPYDNVVKMPRIDVKVDPETPQKEKTKLIKAKTLAEMRRHFEKLKSKTKTELPNDQDKLDKFKEESDETSDNYIPNLISLNSVPPSSHRNSFVLYNKKKMWIPSKFGNKCVAIIDSSRKNTKEGIESPSLASNGSQTTNKKLTLLSTLKQKKACKIKYKAGPLCKKAELQNLESRGQWTTEVKVLPKIYLEIVPEINKPVNPSLVHLLSIFDDVVISEERVNFALSVLKSKSQTTEQGSFKFQIPYHNNQEKMVVRKPFKPAAVNDDSQNKLDTDPAVDVSKILNDIISYVEVKEIEQSLIKDDDTVVEEHDKASDLGGKTKVRKLKRKKLELELLRLNCKVIDVATKETDDKECTKSFCKMGCVCKSLLCESVFSNHCQLIDCMFECKCPPGPANEIIANNNSLSAHTVNHLEDKAKKNLAKVEREFTQTLIHTDNDVILVGTGGRNRNRTTKLPKKFTDFVDNIDEILDSPRQATTPKIIVKKCTVEIPKLNLDCVIPYCLTHNVYNCYCKGEVANFPKKVKTELINHIPKIRIVKSKEDQSKAWSQSCARIRKIFSGYKCRNKDPQYNERLRAKHQRQLQRNMKVDQKYIQEDNETDETVSNNEAKSDKAQSPKKTSKRKQSFNIREDVTSKSWNDIEKEYALQRRKKKRKYFDEDIKKKSTRNEYLDGNSLLCNYYYPIFDGEIRVSLKDNQDMLQVIGEENASLEYLRILPWTKVIESFRTRKMNIWSKEKRSSALLCNAAGYFPPKSFIDIRKIHDKSDIITWILTDNLPPDRPKDLMHLILTPRKSHFLISGYCLKKVDKPIETAVRPNENDVDLKEIKFDNLISSIKLEPLDFESESESFSENQKSLANQVLEQPEIVTESDPLEVTQNLESTDSCMEQNPINDIVQTESHVVSNKQKSLKIGSKPLQTIATFKKIDLQTTTNRMRIRPISELLEAKKTNIDQTQEISNLSIPKGVETISLSELLSSKTGIKAFQSFSKSKTFKLQTDVNNTQVASNSNNTESDNIVISNSKPMKFKTYVKKTSVESDNNQSLPEASTKTPKSNSNQRQLLLRKNLGTKTIITPIMLSSNSKLLKSKRSLDDLSITISKIPEYQPDLNELASNFENNKSLSMDRKEYFQSINKLAGKAQKAEFITDEEQQDDKNKNIMSVSSSTESTPTGSEDQLALATAETTVSSEFLESRYDTNENQSITVSKISQEIVPKQLTRKSKQAISVLEPLESRLVKSRIRNSQQSKKTSTEMEFITVVQSDSSLELMNNSDAQIARDPLELQTNFENVPPESALESNIQAQLFRNPAETTLEIGDFQSLKCASPIASEFGSDVDLSVSIDEEFLESPELKTEPDDSKEAIETSEFQSTVASEPVQTILSSESSDSNLDVKEAKSIARRMNVAKRTYQRKQSKVTVQLNKPTSKRLYNSDQQKIYPGKSMKCTHKDMFNKSKTLILSTRMCTRRKLCLADKKIEMNKIIFARLPRIAKKLRWRMIYLNSDFSFLSFIDANYSIKYTDLMDVVKMSNNTKLSIALKNREFTSCYKHPNFGIYCVCGYQDRLFIGPFLPTEKHNIETLRYLQGKLIDTQIFNKMVGKKADEKVPVWLQEVPNLPRLPSGIVIDITKDDDTNSEDDVCIVDGARNANGNADLTESFLCPPFVEKLTTEEIKAKKINRYMITNIPHLGYFGASQRDNKAIEVFWPNDEKGYRFANVILAKFSLILYLSQIFCPLPQDFTINVVIMTNLDLEANKPVDAKYLTHTKSHICGEFGIYEKEAIPKDLLEHYKVPSVESLLNSPEHAAKNTDRMIRLFALSLMSNEELRKYSEPKDILQWANTEIYILKKLSENYESEKADLRNILRTNSLKIQELKSKIRATNTTKKVNITETIEINDSDDEGTHTKRDASLLKRSQTSGKIHGDSSGIYNKNEGRSLLKPQYLLAGRSLLKTSDTDKQKLNLLSSNPVNVSLRPTEIYIDKPNFLNRRKILVTKTNQ